MPIACVWVFGAGLVGYAAGSRNPEPSREPSPDGSSVRGKSPHTSAERAVREDPILNFQRLVEGKIERRRIWSVVSKIGPQQIPEALERLAAVDLPDWDVAGALYHHWAGFDPQAALAHALSAADERMSNAMMSSVLCAWMNDDPDAAWQAAQGDPATERLAGLMRVRPWTPEIALKHLDQDPKLVAVYASEAAKDREQREAFMAALKDAGLLRSEVSKKLFTAWAEEDFQGAMALLAEEGLPEARDHVLEQHLRVRAFEALPWAVRNGLDVGGQAWLEGYYEWLGYSEHHPEGNEARRWFSEQQPEWRRQGNHQLLMGYLTMNFSQNGPAYKAADGEALVDQWDAWKAADPVAADKWLQSAPKFASDRIEQGGEP